jgi:hypothetical protein
MPQNKMDARDYFWVILNYSGEAESFLGLENPQGQQFIPVTRDKEAAEELLSRLPHGGGRHQVETIHRDNILAEAGKQGFSVQVVDGKGAVLESLTPPQTH